MTSGSAFIRANAGRSAERHGRSSSRSVLNTRDIVHLAHGARNTDWWPLSLPADPTMLLDPGASVGVRRAAACPDRRSGRPALSILRTRERSLSQSGDWHRQTDAATTPTPTIT